MGKVYFSIFILLFCACSSKNVSTGQIIDLFDTAAFLDAEFAQTALTKNVKKTIRYNDDLQELDLTGYDMTKDVDILKLANINNPNWEDKYALDSTVVNENMVDLIYTAVDPKLQIKTLVVRKSGAKIIQFESIEQSNALISQSEKRIVYQSGLGYSISTKSQNLFSPQRSVTVEIQFKSD